MLGARGGEKFRTRKNTLQRNEIVENTNPQFAGARVYYSRAKFLRERISPCEERRHLFHGERGGGEGGGGGGKKSFYK